MQENNKRIAKNTVFLYVRMFLLMAVGLYTSRVILQSLGVDNFGVYNVIAGFVVMFGSITGSLSNAISRFIQVELGKENTDRLKVIFSTSVHVQLIVGIIVSIIIEISGYWFIYYKMQLPSESLYGAIWSLHFTTLTFFLSLLYVPYNACLIAHERISAFAYISIIEALLKLLVSFVIFITPFDKLVTYGLLLFATQAIMQLIYIIYCKHNFPETHYAPIFDIDLLKNMFSFIGWNFFGHCAFVVNIQGTNMLLNTFFGVTVNAARGIANQVNNAVYKFLGSFTTALIPPITKSYSSGNKEYSYTLVMNGDKYSYYLMFLLSLPILLETDYILNLWLHEAPMYAIEFVRWSLGSTLIKTLGDNTMFAIIMADGRIKKYQIVTAIVDILPLFVIWICFLNNCSVVYAYIIYFISQCVLLFIRLFFSNRITGLPLFGYLKDVIGTVTLVSICSAITPLFINSITDVSFVRFLSVSIVSVVSTLTCIYLLGLGTNEKQMVNKRIIKYISIGK